VIAPRGLATLFIVLAACTSSRGPMDVGSPFPFTDDSATQTSGYEGTEPKIEIEKRGGRWFVTIYQGQQPSGGYGIRVEKAVGVGTSVRLRARFTTPGANESVPAVLTSPAHTISSAYGADAFYLYDQDDRKRAELITP
jgi:protease stability complex PrcB-like protein